jgi:hypothetical protein
MLLSLEAERTAGQASGIGALRCKRLGIWKPNEPLGKPAGLVRCGVSDFVFGSRRIRWTSQRDFLRRMEHAVLE